MVLPKPQKAWVVERKLINVVMTVHTAEKKGKSRTFSLQIMRLKLKAKTDFI